MHHVELLADPHQKVIRLDVPASSRRASAMNMIKKLVLMITIVIIGIIKSATHAALKISTRTTICQNHTHEKADRLQLLLQLQKIEEQSREGHIFCAGATGQAETCGESSWNERTQYGSASGLQA